MRKLFNLSDFDDDIDDNDFGTGWIGFLMNA